jgi:hypothetical protein
MNPERPKSQTELRADKVMELIRSGKFTSVPAAVKQILIDERITNKSDVARITSTIGTILQKRKQSVKENQMWEEFLNDQMIEGAYKAYQERGGDPDDSGDEGTLDDYRIGSRL